MRNVTHTRFYSPHVSTASTVVAGYGDTQLVLMHTTVYF